MCIGVGFYLVEGDGPVARGIHVEIYAAIVVEDKVSNGVCSLDGEGVIVPGLQEPGVFGLDEVARRVVGPELQESVRISRSQCPWSAHLVLKVRISLPTALIRNGPLVWDLLGR